MSRTLFLAASRRHLGAAAYSSAGVRSGVSFSSVLEFEASSLSLRRGVVVVFTRANQLYLSLVGGDGSRDDEGYGDGGLMCDCGEDRGKVLAF